MRPSFENMSPEGRNNAGSGILTGSVFIADDLYLTDPEDCGYFQTGVGYTVTLFCMCASSRYFKNKLLI